MKMHRFSIFWGAATLAASAFAGTQAEVSDKMVAPAPAAETCNWSGFYAGASLGLALGDYEFSEFSQRTVVQGFFQEADVIPPDGGQVNTNVDGFIFSEIFSPVRFVVRGGRDDANAGFMGGGQIGFNYLWGNILLGVEGDFHGTDLEAQSGFEQTKTRTFIEDETIQTTTIVADINLKSVRRIETDWLASARARVGWTRGCLLLYATGGVAFADVDLSGSLRTSTSAVVTEEFNIAGIPGEGGVVNGPGIPPTTVTEVGPFNSRIRGGGGGGTEIGWIAGLGGEVMINKWLTIGVEYRHADFGSHDFDFSNSGPLIRPDGGDVDFAVDQVLLKCNILFSSFFGR